MKRITFVIALAIVVLAIMAPQASAHHTELAAGQKPAPCYSWDPWFCYSSQYGSGSNGSVLDTRNAEYWLWSGAVAHGAVNAMNIVADCRIRLGIPAGFGNTQVKGTAYSARQSPTAIIADVVVLDYDAGGYCRYRDVVIGTNRDPALYVRPWLEEFSPHSAPWAYGGPLWY
jgi:hypothetical protein